MSTAKDLAKFLVGIAPELINLGQQLFEAHNGDVSAAKHDIADRQAEVTSNRAARDAQLDDKHRT